MEVKLIAMTPQPEKVMWTAARTCYSSSSPTYLFNEGVTSEECWKLISKVLGSGHNSVAEHVSFTFAIQGVSKSCSHQLVRHRHCTFSQKSQRYVEIKENHGELFDLISGFPTDEKIAKMKEIAEKYFVDVTDNNYYGYIHDLFVYTSRIANGEKAEDARNSLPGATKTDIVMTTNLRNLMHMCDLRLCSRAQLEIRQLFKAIVREVKTENVEIGKLLMAQCERLGYCPEHKSCGRMPVRG